MDAQERQRIITALEGMALVKCCHCDCFRFRDSPNFFGGIPGRITLIFETNKIQGERSLSNLVWERYLEQFILERFDANLTVQKEENEYHLMKEVRWLFVREQFDWRSLV